MVNSPEGLKIIGLTLVWVTFVGPFRDMLGVRSGGWFWCYEDCMLELDAAQELEESLSHVEASVHDLISAEEFFSMAGPTFQFWESQMTAEDIAEMVQAGFSRRVVRSFHLLVRLFLTRS